MSYAKNLALARANNINILALDIGYEVACIFGEDHPQFEHICAVVERAYCKYDLSINDIAWSLHEMLHDGSVTLESFLDYGEDYHKVLENACYMHC